MCSCHSILECCVTFSGVKLSIRSFVLLHWQVCELERYSETFKFERAGEKLNNLLVTVLVYSYETVG